MRLHIVSRAPLTNRLTIPVTVSVAGLAAASALVSLTACSSGSNPSTAPAPAPTASVSSSATGSASPSTSPSPSSSPSEPHATEFNPPGDIPDDAVFVDHTAPGSRVHFTIPEGWARSTAHGVTTFTDKYNSVSVEVVPRGSAPTPASARKRDVPALRRTVSSFAPGDVEQVSRAHGSAVQITYLLDSEPNPVTGKVVRDAAERFEFWHAGEEAILTLTGPQHADNVDPWQIVSDSLQWK